MSSYTPDILARNLAVVFCGINPAKSAVSDGHNFSHRNNRFWSVLHLAGFTDVRLEPQDERRLLKYGCGITAVVERATRRSSDVKVAEFIKARPAFVTKMRRYSPHAVAFLGKRAFSAITEQPVVRWGLQSEEFSGTKAWVLPNPSGLNRGFTLKALVEAYSELRSTLKEGVQFPAA